MSYLKNIFTIIIVAATLFFSCENKQSSQENTQEIISKDSLKYAKGFSIEHYKNYIGVSVFNPLAGNQLYGRYYLCENKETKVPEDGTKILVPLKSIAVTSCTHFEFLALIGEIDKITGVCESKRIYNPNILQKIDDGKIVDLGDSFSLNFEKLLGLKPDVLMTSGYAQQDENSRRIARAGLPVLYNNEWMEKSLLARAEWIKFVAAFFNRSATADSVFDNIEARFIEAGNVAGHAAQKPTIMTGSDFRGTWYVPGGQSYVAELYRKAGGNYFYQNDSTSGSISLSMETALKNFVDADVWLWCNFKTMQELKSMNERYALFKAFKTGNVYSNMKRSTPSGGNDYWESAVARPDIILQDMIKVLHPELLPDHELFYLEKLR
ncbi:MAG: ABC transporter substrate-binding protein [Candidatus Azobacteroides sp.]|nr:ABC transporter substrate-binding protein [Candidatus Azobacteroides sp.]